MFWLLMLLALVIWMTVVFRRADRAAALLQIPYILWLIAGIVPWFFFSEALGSGAGSLLEYNFLVKKVVFKL